MSTLTPFFRPKSVAVIGASNRPLRAGNVVMNNLLQSKFDGAIMPVTPRYKAVCGVLAYPDVNALPLVPDVAILCTNASHNIEVFEQLAQCRVPVAIILSSDMNKESEKGKSIQQQCEEIAARAGIKILGPNSLGVLLPWQNFNASFSPISALRGNIAFISQSAAVCTTILDWAYEKQIGFSAFISLGNASDIDFADLLDFLSTDTHTDSILLYIDSIRDARRFISASRAASRNKRILVLKGGRTLEGSAAAYAHTGGIESLDIIYDSVIRRSGMLRVQNTHELFAAVETLTHSVPLRGERLAIITNGGGPAIMAVDTLLDRGGKLAQLDDDIRDKLSAILPSSWSHSNPIDLVGDADDQRYVQVLNLLLDSDIADAILVMHCPSAVAQSDQTAQAIIDTLQAHPKSRQFNVLTNWAGETTTKNARALFNKAKIPTYRTAESAVIALMHMVEYKRNQKQLIQTPTSESSIPEIKLKQARTWIQHSLDRNAHHLDTHQIGELLSLFNFNVLATWLAADHIEAGNVADKIGYPVAVKLRSPDIAHKSDVHGVVLNLHNRSEVEDAAVSIINRVKQNYPDARIESLVVQAMAQLAGGEELRLKVKNDQVFGPVILIGQGGSEWNIALDAEASLPPLNNALARYVITKAIRNGKLRLKQLPGTIDIDALAGLMVKVSQMIIECPEIHEIDFHPLLANNNKFTVLDADITLRAYSGPRQKRLAIRPYPSELESKAQLKDGRTILLRPILPEDEPLHADFIKHVSKEDLYRRFFTEVGEFNHEALANLTQIDFDREMAFVAVMSVNHQDTIIGVSRALVSPDNQDSEFAILVRSDMKGMGLGYLLMDKIIEYCKVKQTKRMSGMTMPTNRGMLQLAQKMGFSIDVQFEDGTADMSMELN
ncbi:bifunctional acetate--CoA ligase family protein/GNAT family N-acetyltransferase [Vibrio sp. RC27]